MYGRKAVLIPCAGYTAIPVSVHAHILIDTLALSECLYDWLGSRREAGTVVAIDGKTICGGKSESHKACHMVIAFVAEN